MKVDLQSKPSAPLSVVTVRMPPSLHAGLVLLAHDRRTTMNLLCVELIAKAVEENGGGLDFSI